MAGDDDHVGRLGQVVFDGHREHLEAAAVGQEEVDQDELRPERAEQSAGFCEVGSRGGLEALALDDLDEGVPGVGIVLDDERAELRGGSFRGLDHRTHYYTGSVGGVHGSTSRSGISWRRPFRPDVRGG